MVASLQNQADPARENVSHQLDIDVGNGQEAYDLKAVDLNKDGRLDLLLAGRQSDNVAWYINQPD